MPKNTLFFVKNTKNRRVVGAPASDSLLLKTAITNFSTWHFQHYAFDYCRHLQK